LCTISGKSRRIRERRSRCPLQPVLGALGNQETIGFLQK
jgi:hypothetical protein